ncbi:MAG: hypothetical protein MK132_03880 [Lentisphaerales bacterium]|nr:hypothetical protein [Lentisphaerales bacterium]
MMNKLLFLFLSLSNFLSQASELLSLADDGLLEVKKIDPTTGELTDFQKIEHSKLSKFSFSNNKDFMYVQASMKNKPKQLLVITYKVEANGKLTYL